jgi:hypothetical protein
MTQPEARWVLASSQTPATVTIQFLDRLQTFLRWLAKFQAQPESTADVGFCVVATHTA